MLLFGRTKWWVPSQLARILPRLPMEDEPELSEENMRTGFAPAF